MVKLKKVMSIVMIIMILFTFVKYPKVYAVDNVIIDNPYNRQLIATMIIASGIVFNTKKQIDDTVTMFIDNWNDHETGWKMPGGPNDPKTWAELLFYITAVGVTVYDLGADKIKQVINMPKNLMDYFKEWVNDKFDEGENIINIESDFYYYNNNYYKVVMEVTSTNLQFYNILQDGTRQILVDSPLSANYFDFKIYNLNGRPYALHMNKNKIWLTTYPYIPLVGEEINTGEIIEVIGTPDIVDNPNYNYTHNYTDEPTIVIPIQSPELDETGYFVPKNDLNDLVDVGVDEIANESTDGIVLPIPTPSPSPEPVPYPNLPGEDTATEEDYDNTNKRALYQRKFPFCLPWDIRAVFMLLNAPSKAPRFEIDVVPGSVKGKIGISGETKFVFDMAEFELIGQVTRFFSFIGFCLTLIFITRNIIKS